MEKLLKLKTAAEMLAISQNTLRQWESQGYLAFVRLGPKKTDYLGRDRRQVRMRKGDVDKLINQQITG